MGYLIAGIVMGVIWGAITQKVMDNKGYEENWFWWGFFFGWIPLVIAISKPRADDYTPLQEHKRPVLDVKSTTVQEATWRCRCGREHAAYVSSCTCGASKRDRMDKAVSPKLPEPEKKLPEKQPLTVKETEKDALSRAGVWRCRCGRMNPLHAAYCACGMERDTMLEERPDRSQENPPKFREKTDPSQEAEENKMLDNGGWRCLCGRVNARFITACPCGLAREEAQSPKPVGLEPGEILLPPQKDPQPKPQKSLETEREVIAVIRAYKELLDLGAITQEEFDNKKRELM